MADVISAEYLLFPLPFGVNVQCTLFISPGGSLVVIYIFINCAFRREFWAQAAMVTRRAIVLTVLVTLSVVVKTSSQLPIPPRYDGFVYKNRVSADSILVEAFFDPLCPDSRDSWWPLKEVLRYYKHNITFIVHPFPLPYVISAHSLLDNYNWRFSISARIYWK